MPTDRSIALFLEHASNPYVQQVGAEASREAADHALRIETFFADNPFLQIQQIYAKLHAPVAERPVALLVYPMNDSSLGRAASAALAQGVDWICLHRSTGALETLRREYPDRAITLVTPDQTEIGRLQGRLVSALATGPRILVVQGSAANASTRLRLAGLREVVGSSHEILGVVDGNWTTQDARDGVERWLRVMAPSLSRLDGIVAQSDTMAIGAVAALRTAAEALSRPELARAPVVGCDGLADVGRQLVDRGELAATIVLRDVGSHAVRVVAQRIAGQLPPSEVVLPCFPYPARALELRSRAGTTPADRP
jgi:ABC-type sugar transport system substrate-binding protein